MTPWDYLKAINETKEAIIVDETTEKEYLPFIVNRGLSYFPDTVLYANEMNRRPSLDKLLQFEYLRGVVRKRKRYSKWAKAEKNEDIDLVITYYGVSRTKALTMLSILTPENLAQIRLDLNEGGKK